MACRFSRIRSEMFTSTLPPVSSALFVPGAEIRRISQLLPILPDCRLQPRRLLELCVQCGGEPLHLLLERLVIRLGGLRAYVAAGGEDVAMRADFIQRGALAESGHVRILLPAVPVPAPGVIRIRDLSNVLCGKLPMDAVDHRPEFPGVEEEHLPAPVAEAAVFLVAGDKPETNRDL